MRTQNTQPTMIELFEVESSELDIRFFGKH